MQRVRLSEAAQAENRKASYQLKNEEKDDTATENGADRRKQTVAERPAVQPIIIPPAPAPAARRDKPRGLIARLFGSLFGVPDKAPAEPTRKQGGRGNRGQRGRGAEGGNRERPRRVNKNQPQRARNPRTGRDNADKRQERPNQAETDGAKRNTARRGRRGGARRRRPENAEAEAGQNRATGPSAQNGQGPAGGRSGPASGQSNTAKPEKPAHSEAGERPGAPVKPTPARAKTQAAGETGKREEKV